LLNIIVDIFGLRTEFSRLYPPEGHNSISIQRGYKVQMNM